MVVSLKQLHDGAAIGADGRFSLRGGYDGNERAKPRDIYQLIFSGFTRDVQAGNIIAFALAANVNIPSAYNPPSPDGLRVLLETEGHCRFIYVPYVMAQKGIFRKTKTAGYGEPIPVELTASTCREFLGTG